MIGVVAELPAAQIHSLTSKVDQYNPLIACVGAGRIGHSYRDKHINDIIKNRPPLIASGYKILRLSDLNFFWKYDDVLFWLCIGFRKVERVCLINLIVKQEPSFALQFR